MTDDKKNVHILVPRGFQNRELLKHDGSEAPQNGECLKCKGTGAIPNRVWLEDVEVKDGRIVTCTPKMAFFKCRCYMGQFWVKMHPVNIQARVLPKFEKEITAMLEREKQWWIRESGGNYTPGSDTFLKDLGVKPEVKSSKILSLDEILRDRFKNNG